MSFTLETIGQLREVARRSQSTALLDAFRVSQKVATNLLQLEMFNVSLGYEIAPVFSYESLQSPSSWSLETGPLRAGCPVNVRRRRNARDNLRWDYYVVFHCEGWQLGVNETDIMRSLEYAIEDWMCLCMALVHYYRYTYDEIRRWVDSDEPQLLLEYQSVGLLQRGISKKQLVPRARLSAQQQQQTSNLTRVRSPGTAIVQNLQQQQAVTAGGELQITSTGEKSAVVQQLLSEDTVEFKTALGNAVCEAGLVLPASASVWVERHYDPSQHAKPYKYYMFKMSDEDDTRKYYTRPKALTGILKKLSAVSATGGGSTRHQREEEEEEAAEQEQASETLSQKRRRVHEEDDDDDDEEDDDDDDEDDSEIPPPNNNNNNDKITV